MNFEKLSQLAASIESIATVIALVLGGLWAYRRFVRQREDYPHIDFRVDLRFVGLHSGSWVVEIIAWLENKGRVQHKISKFTFDLRYLIDSDKLQRAEQFGGQILFPHKAAKGSWLPQDWEFTFIDPGIRTHYSYIGTLPAEARIALLHGWFEYQGGREWHSAEKIVPVPEGPSAAA
ncbi:MAG: hypothetical protein P8075_01955 [Deltaproteobacteria bacterium]|jgi:hypothetical protein